MSSDMVAEVDQTHTWVKAGVLGRWIVAAYPYRPGDVISLSTVMDKLKVSRPMAREILQVLHQKRLVDLRPRVGATVLSVDEWDVFDSDVIRWRLAIAPRFPMRSLTEIRRSVEPRVASLAAQRASADICRDLVGLSRKLADIGRDKEFQRNDAIGAGVRQKYLDIDLEFHRTLLRGSGNEMFIAMAGPISTALTHRIKQDWEGLDDYPAATDRSEQATTQFPRQPEEIALWLHRGLAYAVEQGNPTAAEAFAAAILDEFCPSGIRDPVLRYGLRQGLRLLPTDRFDDQADDQTEWTHFCRAVNSIAKEIPVVVMGVAGSGKSTVGELLAKQLGARFIEADYLHPPANRAKMEDGIPLTDEDRRPWLEAVAETIADHADSGVVVSCSALTCRYRDILREERPDTWFLHLRIDEETATRRVASRQGHFMPASLVASQFQTLEQLADKENGLTVDATRPVARIIAEARNHLDR